MKQKSPLSRGLILSGSHDGYFGGYSFGRLLVFVGLDHFKDNGFQRAFYRYGFNQNVLKKKEVD